ncbi:MAG: ubiquinone/menaquinone biosynthesis methyltransferase [Terriglobales bacterium]
MPAAGPDLGSRPAGVAPEAAAAHVRAMFDRIAPSYDRANHVLSLEVDHYWRWRTARALRRRLAGGAAAAGSQAPRVLDVCCGTGDLGLALARHLRGAQVLGADFSPAMLARARRKRPAGCWLQADGLQLPLADGCCDAVATAFGFRNFTDYRAALAELKRVLRPGGWLAILEIAEPTTPGLRQLYLFYFRRLLPLLGGWISGERAAYRYLPRSVGRFPAPAELAQWMRDAGFDSVRVERLSLGLAALHLGRKGK